MTENKQNKITATLLPYVGSSKETGIEDRSLL